MDMTWHGDTATARLRAALAKRLVPALDVAQERMHELIGVQGPPRSDPYNPPHIDTGQLYDSLATEVDAGTLTARLGSFVEWAVYLEQGTPFMAPRPWFLSSILQTQHDIAKELVP